jgi:hypothetical protein
MDDYHKRPSHHGLSDLLGDKMKDEKGYDITAKKCKSCWRDGMPAERDEEHPEECASCIKCRKLYLVRKDIIKDKDFKDEHTWHMYDFTDDDNIKHPILADEKIDSAWYLDNFISSHLRMVMRNRMHDYQKKKGVPSWKRGGTTQVWKKADSYRKGKKVSRKSPLVSACCFKIGDRMKGNDGWTYRVKLRKDGTNFWSKT